MPLDALTLTGGPSERGIAHGEAFADEIAANVEAYLDRFAYYGIDAEDARELAADYRELIDEVAPDYAAEMEAVADGSGVPGDDVALLNARYEVMYAAFSDKAAENADAGAAADGCTSFGLEPDVTETGHAYVGQTWDWLPTVADNLFVMRLDREDGPNAAAFTEAGIVGGKIGVNEHGIGVALNGLATPEDGDVLDRTPLHVRSRRILDADRFDLAIDPILSEPRVCSSNLLLGHESGQLIDVEAAPETANYLYPEDGVLAHANHFEGGGVESELEKLGSSTLLRKPRMRRLLCDAADEDGVTVEDVQAALADHLNHPSSICSHVEESAPKGERGQTNFAAVLDLSERRMLGAGGGPPCENEYRAYDVPE